MRPAALLCLALGGCSLVPGGAQYQAALDAGTDTAIADVQHFTDRALYVYAKGMCAVTVGAYARLEEGAIKQGIALICGLQPTAAVLRPAPVAATGAAPIAGPAGEAPPP